MTLRVPRYNSRMAKTSTTLLGLGALVVMTSQLLAAPTPPAPQPAGKVAATAAANSVAVERRLHLANVEASSFLWDDFNRFQQNYNPMYLGDDDPKTAWVEGVKGHGIGEWFRLKFTPMEGASKVRLKIRNGYQKSDKLFAMNSRLKEVALKLLPSGKTQNVTLKDEQGFQEIVLDQPAGPVDAVELKVVSAYPGSKWDDLTVSDVQLFVTATTRENPAYEKARLEKLLTWKSERATAAANFKKTASQYNPLLPQYQVVRKDLDSTYKESACGGDDSSEACGFRRAVEEAQHNKLVADAVLTVTKAVVEKNFAALQPVRVVPVNSQPMLAPDGMCIPRLNSCLDDGCYEATELPMADHLAFLRADGFHAFEEKSNPAILSALHAEGKECSKRDPGRSFFYAYRPKNAEGRESLRALLQIRCGKVESREGMSPAARAQLLIYDEAGLLQVVTSPYSLTAMTFASRAQGPVLVAAKRINGGQLITVGEPKADNSSDSKNGDKP